MDILKVFQSVESAQERERKRAFLHERREAIEADIRDLFAQYDGRRRSFGALRDSLGIFDTAEKQEVLKDILWEMGAEPKGGLGDKKMWHLPDDTNRRVNQRKPETPWSLIYAIILVVLLAAGAVTLLDFSRFQGPEICDANWTAERFDTCLNNGGIDGSAPQQ